MITIKGFVNAHSHAFQRALRGRVEKVGASHDDFWSWREAMYACANVVDTSDVYDLARWAYLDMWEAGFAAVGEFHYLHHVGGNASSALARAARDVGIRLVLLETAYARRGFDDDTPTERQRRFTFNTVSAFLDHAARSRERHTGNGVSVGLAVHSVRACPTSWIEAVAAQAQAWRVPLHVHACEQIKEVDDCLRATGLTPIALLDRCGALSPMTTLVHATHLNDDDIALIAARGCLVCLTPSTERNLGDGLCRITDLYNAGVALCIGSDSHARIDAVDELRSIEDHERLRLRKRHALGTAGQRLHEVLLPIGIDNGARSLGLSVDDLKPIDVDLPIEGTIDRDSGVDAWLVGGSSRDVIATQKDATAIRARAATVLRRIAGHAP